MNHTRASIQVVSFALASVAAVACSRARKPEPVVETTSATSAQVAIAAADGASQQVCRAPGDEPAATTANAPAPKPSRAIAAAPARHPKAKPEPQEAIAREMAKDGHQDATPASAATPTRSNASPQVPVSQVTTTGATLPLAQPARTLAPARIAFENRLPASYRLERVRMIVDGAVSFDARTPGSLQVGPGDHVVEVVTNYRLRDPVFTYVNDHLVELRSTEIVPASPASTAFVATAHPSGGVTTPMSKRAELAWRSFRVR